MIPYSKLDAKIKPKVDEVLKLLVENMGPEFVKDALLEIR